MTTDMRFHPPLVLDSNSGNAAKNYPIALRIYSSTSDKSELYRLRYRAFLDSGWIAENPQREFSDRYDDLTSTFALGAFHDGECIGSLRLALGGSETTRSMPCEEQFSAEIEALDAAGNHRLLEFSRMAVEPTLTNNSFRTTLYASLVRAGFILAHAADIDVALIAVHRKFSTFYQAMCGFRILGRSDSYADIAEPTHFLGRNFQDLDGRRLQRNTFFRFTSDEVERARRSLRAAQQQAAA